MIDQLLETARRGTVRGRIAGDDEIRALIDHALAAGLGSEARYEVAPTALAGGHMLRITIAVYIPPARPAPDGDGDTIVRSFN